MSAKQVILTAIYFKGTKRVKEQAKELAQQALCSEAYVKNICRQVETQKIQIR